MIISRTPFRISFFGGGTDFPQWYREHGGSVLSTTINKYCYIQTRFLPPFFDYNYAISYAKREYVNSIDKIEHPVVREGLKYLDIKDGVEMSYFADLPARSGIGSSSSFSVGFLNAFNSLKGVMKTKRELAQDAINLEQNIIKENVGSQDQVAASFGGINRIDFGGKRNFFVTPVIASDEKIELLQNHLMLFFSGIYRKSSDVVQEQIKQIPNKYSELMELMSFVDEGVKILTNGNEIEDFGKLLHEAWLIKKSLSNKISNDYLDNIYNRARNAGAIGGKITGAGAGGFFLFFVPPNKQKKVRETLKDLVHVPFGFEFTGSQIVFFTKDEKYD